ncbi:MAG: MFS transporter, partial [Acidobacteria bacterium]|nr:MFS transporter [Acidobacteriota bacterium]
MIRGERQKWVSLAVLFAVAMLNYADRTSISAVFPLLRAELAMSDVGLAALGSFFLWSYAAGSPLAGLLADRYSRSRMVVGSLAAWSLVTLWTGMARSAEELLLTRVLLGLTECAYLPAAIALIADHHPTASRATAIGIHTAGLNFGLVAGGTLAGYLGDHVGWRPGFFILGGAGVALAGLAAAVLRDAPRPASKPAQAPSARESVARLARIPSYWILLGEGMLMAVGIWMFFNWLPLYFRETFNMSLAGAGLSGTLMLQVAATLGAVGGGYFSDQIARRNPNRRMLFQSLCYLAGAPLLLAFLGRPAFGFLGACIFGFALLRALGGASQLAVLSDLLPSQFRSTSIGLMNTANCFAGGIG